MLRSALVALAVIAGSLPSFACETCLDPKIHRLCLESSDYPSCVSQIKDDDATAANKEESASLDVD